MQHEMIVRGPLLDGMGRLTEAGWARSPLKAYDRGAIRACGLRIKEWDYYCVLGPRFGAAFTLADNSYLGLVSASLLDLEAATEITSSLILPLTSGRMGAPSSSDEGDFTYEGKGLSLRFLRRPGERVIEIDWPGFSAPGRGRLARRGGRTGSGRSAESALDGRRGLSGRIALSQPPADSIVMATPFREKKTAFYYNQKINCLPASGDLDFGGLPLDFEPPDSSAVLDWGRGVWTYANTWYWASCSASLDGSPFGFNLGYGFGDTSAASENVLFCRGKAHKLGDVSFEIPRSSFLEPWRLSGADGRLDLTFSPLLDRAADSNLLLLRSNQHQVFGRYSGKALLDDGSVLELRDLVGFAEKVENRW